MGTAALVLLAAAPTSGCLSCGHLVEQGWETAGDEDEDAPVVMAVGVGDDVEFVFLELGVTGVMVCLRKVARREEHA